MKLRPERIAVARIAVVALLAAAVVPPVRAQEAGSLAGRVFDPDGRTPRGGVTVALVGDDGAAAARSRPTSDEGAFAIERADPGRYRLLVEAPEGAFVTDDPLELRPGANNPLALTLTPGRNHQESSTTTTSGEPLPQWAKWAIAGGIAAVGLWVIVETNDDDDPASDY
jgi:hypothetical protein